MDVDNLSDWFIVSNVQIRGEPWAEVLFSKEYEIANIEIAKSRGSKCPRCWHYELELVKGTKGDQVCKRCSDILERI